MNVISMTWACDLIWLMLNLNFFLDLLNGDLQTLCGHTCNFTIVVLVLCN